VSRHEGLACLILGCETVRACDLGEALLPWQSGSSLPTSCPMPYLSLRSMCGRHSPHLHCCRLCGLLEWPKCNGRAGHGRHRAVDTAGSSCGRSAPTLPVLRLCLCCFCCLFWPSSLTSRTGRQWRLHTRHQIARGPLSTSLHNRTASTYLRLPHCCLISLWLFLPSGSSQ
jgi:hypothetical protein